MRAHGDPGALAWRVHHAVGPSLPGTWSVARASAPMTAPNPTRCLARCVMCLHPLINADAFVSQIRSVLQHHATCGRTHVYVSTEAFRKEAIALYAAEGFEPVPARPLATDYGAREGTSTPGSRS